MIDDVNASANAQEFSIAVDTHTNFCFSIQHYLPEHVYNIEIGADVQPIKESILSLLIMGKEPVTSVLLDKEINENKINNGNGNCKYPSFAK